MATGSSSRQTTGRSKQPATWPTLHLSEVGLLVRDCQHSGQPPVPLEAPEVNYQT